MQRTHRTPGLADSGSQKYPTTMTAQGRNSFLDSTYGVQPQANASWDKPTTSNPFIKNPLAGSSSLDGSAMTQGQANSAAIPGVDSPMSATTQQPQQPQVPVQDRLKDLELQKLQQDIDAANQPKGFMEKANPYLQGGMGIANLGLALASYHDNRKYQRQAMGLAKEKNQRAREDHTAKRSSRDSLAGI